MSFFDSTILTRNATGPTSTLPNPPRYGKNNTIAYADGHVHP
jgi:prepilin-type processing-associated H-X9-DG protein